MGKGSGGGVIFTPWHLQPLWELNNGEKRMFYKTCKIYEHQSG